MLSTSKIRVICLGNMFSSKMTVLNYLENCDLARTKASCKVFLQRPICNCTCHTLCSAQ